MPDILITGGNNGSNGALTGLLGMKLKEERGGKISTEATSPPVPLKPARPFEPIS